MPRRVRLAHTVRPDEQATLGDLGQVRWALSRIGLYDPARDSANSEAVMGPGLQRALRVFQNGQGLREDAALKPRGPTERRLNHMLDESRDLRTDHADREARAARESMPGVLASRVGRRLENHPDDVASVGAALRQLGYISPENVTRPNMTALFRALGRFQNATGLTRDGVIAPGGPTEQLMMQALTQREPNLDSRATPLIQGAGRPAHKHQGAFEKANRDETSYNQARVVESPVAPLQSTERHGLAARGAEPEFSNASTRGGERTQAPSTPRRDHISSSSDHAPRSLDRLARKVPPTPERKPPPPPTIRNPTGGIERNDPAGSGWFYAPRGDRDHKGVDIEADPGEPVLSPIDGIITQRGKVYRGDKRYDSIRIQGTGRHEGMEIRIFYVDRNGPVIDGDTDGTGAPVKAGFAILGSAQDVSKKWNDEEDDSMKPHVHLEVYWRGQLIDPAKILPDWVSQKPN